MEELFRDGSEEGDGFSAAFDPSLNGASGGGEVAVGESGANRKEVAMGVIARGAPLVKLDDICDEESLAGREEETNVEAVKPTTDGETCSKPSQPIDSKPKNMVCELIFSIALHIVKVIIFVILLPISGVPSGVRR